jgi:hypothetical protein
MPNKERHLGLIAQVPFFVLNRRLVTFWSLSFQVPVFPKRSFITEAACSSISGMKWT